LFVNVADVTLSFLKKIMSVSSMDKKLELVKKIKIMFIWCNFVFNVDEFS